MFIAALTNENGGVESKSSDWTVCCLLKGLEVVGFIPSALGCSANPVIGIFRWTLIKLRVVKCMSLLFARISWDIVEPL